MLRLFDAVVHIRQWDLPSLGVGLLTIAVIVGLDRTRLKRLSFALGVVVATVLLVVWRPESVALVSDTTEIPRSLPLPQLPDLSLVSLMIVPALVIAIIAMVQASSISGSVPNPDGEYPDPSGDGRGQGVGNVAAGLVGGLPVGGSLSGTFLVRSVGGRSRWANIFTGIFAAVAVLLISPLLGRIPVSTLAGLLILIGISMIKVRNIKTVLHTGPFPAVVMGMTFVCTLVLPLQVAVGLGVGLHILLHIYRSAEAVRLERWEVEEDGGFREAAVPAALPDRECVVLVPVGSLFFAGATEFEEHLPEVGEAERSVVLLVLRDRDEVGSTFVKVCRRYARRLNAAGCRLVFVGVGERVMEQIRDTGLLALVGEAGAYPATKALGEATTRALRDARQWIDEA